MNLSLADHSVTPPLIEVPRDYNAAYDLLQRNAARAAKTAYIDAASGTQLSYGELAQQALRCGNTLRAAGFAPESRSRLCLLATLAWPVG
mgnify:CR=1 FL=1